MAYYFAFGNRSRNRLPLHVLYKPGWILEDGTWNDRGYWDDNAYWID